jgi:hypothetical protein
MWESDGPTDEKYWYQTANLGLLEFQTDNDTTSAPVTYLSVARTGTTVDAIGITATTTTLLQLEQ